MTNGDMPRKSDTKIDALCIYPDVSILHRASFTVPATETVGARSGTPYAVTSNIPSSEPCQFRI
jgi:hypothetical protein